MSSKWLPYIGANEANSRNTIYAVLAEFLGTLVLVLFSCGSALESAGSPADIVRVSLTFGFTVATMAQVHKYIIIQMQAYFLSV